MILNLLLVCSNAIVPNVWGANFDVLSIFIACAAVTTALATAIFVVVDIPCSWFWLAALIMVMGNKRTLKITAWKFMWAFSI
jgi:hypothetical protein